MSKSYHVHLVDRSSARRARFAREIIGHHLHVEIYESLDELNGVSSIRGSNDTRWSVILISDDQSIDFASAVNVLRGMDCYLPVIAYSNDPATSRQIVAAIQSGAADYMCFPQDFPLLRERIASVVETSRDLARRYQRQAQARARLARLSVRETEVLQATIEGATSRETADRLGLSPRTVEVHRAAILQKLEVGTSAAAIAVGIAGGLLDSSTTNDPLLSRAA
jgi:FixJ family two-component response regulator